MGNSKDLSDRRFGHLRVVKLAYAHGGHLYWHCLCDCGMDTVVRSGHLLSGHTNSCGCRKGRYTHRESNTRLYTIWNGMRSRCRDVDNPFYGAKGIAVCEEWHRYESFRDWALAHGYRDGLSIDRIDNNSGYSPENCRWATPKEQANNTRKTRLITYNGETHSVCEWARKLNIKQSTLNMRLNKYGWSVEDALGKEVKRYGTE